MNAPDKLIIHCADTPNGRKQTVQDIDQWHGERTPPFMRSDKAKAALNPELSHIGYHYVIYVDGTIHQGRAETEIGAHCQGENQTSIGVCLIGKDKYTEAQWAALAILAAAKGLPAYGHYQFPSARGKTCPNFDVELWASNGRKPEPEHVL